MEHLVAKKKYLFYVCVEVSGDVTELQFHYFKTPTALPEFRCIALLGETSYSTLQFYFAA